MSYRPCSTFKIELLLLVTVIAVSIPGIAMAACVCGGGDGLLTVDQAMAIDGLFTDWAVIHADVDNNVCDSTDNQPGERDGDIQSTGRDVVHFSFTYDNNYVYLFTERAGSSQNTQKFLYYADVNNDGFMQEGEPIIGVEWQGNQALIDIRILSYDAVDDVNGDSMIDTAGFGDGYALPGKINKPIPKAKYSGNWGSTDGHRMEFRIPWGDLGVPARTGHSIHVSSTNASLSAASLSTQIDDNLGGCGGGSGSTQFADLTFAGAYSLSGQRNSTVWGLGAHHLVNLGNGDDTFAIASSITGTHFPVITYWEDDGDLLFNAALDQPIASTVAIAVDSSVDLFIVYDIIGTATAGVATVVTTATSEFNPAQADSVTDIVRALVPSLMTMKYISSISDTRSFNNTNPKPIPGAEVNYTVTVNNTGDGYVENDTTFLTDRIPAGVEMYVSGIPASAADVNVGTSTLSYTTGASFGDTSDDISFTSESGASPAYTYTPVPDPVDGYDSSVTGLRINPKGTFAASSDITIQFTVRVK